jgi:oxalate---CoA ligase
VLDVQPIGIHDNFFELGGHSLIAVRLFAEIERVLGQNILLSTLFQRQTIAELAEVFSTEESTEVWQSLVRVKSGNPKVPPLFCIHAIWGNVLFYRNFAQYLDIDRPVYGLQAKGLDGEHKPCESIEEMATNYIQEIQSVQPQGPYFLLGYSLGGLIAFEIAQQLQAQGQEIKLLALLDPTSPNLTRVDLERETIVRDSLLTKTISHVNKLLELNIKDSAAYIWERLYWNLTMGRINILYKAYLRYIKRSTNELQIMSVYWANYLTQDTYIPKQYPGKITLFKSEELDIGAEDNSESEWRFLANAGLDIVSVPGVHAQIMEEPNIRTLCAKFNTYLSQIANVTKTQVSQ